jgi:hypothetical protein
MFAEPVESRIASYVFPAFSGWLHCFATPSANISVQRRMAGRITSVFAGRSLCQVRYFRGAKGDFGRGAKGDFGRVLGLFTQVVDRRPEHAEFIGKGRNNRSEGHVPSFPADSGAPIRLSDLVL